MRGDYDTGTVKEGKKWFKYQTLAQGIYVFAHTHIYVLILYTCIIATLIKQLKYVRGSKINEA